MSLGLTNNYLHYGSATSNPQRDSVINGTIWVDAEFGFSVGDFGYNIRINGTNNLIIITWKEALCSSKNDAKIWKEGEFSRRFEQ